MNPSRYRLLRRVSQTLLPQGQADAGNASGGTSATAMATPAIELAMLRCVCEKAAALPAVSAMIRSSRVGDVREMISESASLRPSDTELMNAIATTRTVPAARVMRDRVISRRLKVTSP